MSIAFTYDTLKAALQDWPEDDDAQYVANLDNVIALGETRCVRDLNLELFDEINSALTTAVGLNPVTKPAGLIQTRTLWIPASTTRPFLERRSYEWCLDYAPTGTPQGEPEYFAERDELTWYVVPKPDAIYAMSSRYVARPAGLAIGNQNTWFGDNAGDFLFAACLMEAEHYLKADDRYADFKTKYFQELLPSTRAELRNSIRASDYHPVKTASRKAEG